jgi:YggT family protein
VGLVLVLQVLFVLIYLFILLLFARFIMQFVLSYSRRWVPGRGAAATLESVWTVTDPPLKALRRVIPPLRIGSVSIDLALLVLLVMLFVLYAVVRSLIGSLGSA